jgi:hypothetical protein
VSKFLINKTRKTLSQFLIAAGLLCAFFGNGVHIHSFIDHIFDHGDVHLVVHAHSHSDKAGDDHTSDSENEDHEVATIDLFGVIAQSRVISVQNDVLQNSLAILPQSDFIIEGRKLLYLNLPPPDIQHISLIPVSFSLRAPPLA